MQPSRTTASALIVVLFLLAAIGANLVVAAFGQAALVLTAWVLIPFDLFSRDVLHDRWRHDRLWLRMTFLIATGSALTAIVSWDARRVALASFVAFACSGTTDALVYHAMIAKSRLVRMNASNLCSALVDSIAFPVVAFGLQGTSVILCAAQAGSKFLGGLAWSALYVVARAARARKGRIA